MATVPGGTAPWSAPANVFPLGTTLALLAQFVEPDLYVAHRKLVKPLGTKHRNDVQPTEGLVIGGRLRGKTWANNISQPPIQIVGESRHRRNDWPASGGLMKGQVLHSHLITSLAGHILSLSAPGARGNPDIGSEPVWIWIDRFLTALTSSCH